MARLRFNSLQQRLILLLLLPTAAVLVVSGWVEFYMARNIMLDQWEESALLKLERAAHFVDMRIDKPKELIELFNSVADSPESDAARLALLDRIEKMQGVVAWQLSWDHDRPTSDDGPAPTRPGRGMRRPGTGRAKGAGMRHFHRGMISKVTPPAFDAKAGARTVTLVATLLDEDGQRAGQLDVSISFDYIIADILRLGWWQSLKAGLVTDSGEFIAHTTLMGARPARLGADGDRLGETLLMKLTEQTAGAFRGPGRPPDQVAGFHRLAAAPWSVVVFAPAAQVLAPVIRFRNFFIWGSVGVVAAVLLLIRRQTGNMVRAIEKIAAAAGRVARGDYGKPLKKTSNDELGRLIEAHNTMVAGLKQRDVIRNTFGRYIDDDLARRLLERPEVARLGGDKRTVAILMADIRGFTPLAEQLSPETTLALLNRFFSAMIDQVKDHGGIVVDFIGDGLLAFFDPLDGDIAPVAEQALACARAMQRQMIDINRDGGPDRLPELHLGIGLHAGAVVVGNIGSDTRAKYGIVGSAVNLTQRIQAVADAGQIVVSDAMLDCLQARPSIQTRMERRLKGVAAPLKLSVIA